ncbi:hypothetical protein [Methanocalculus sp.]|uniref:hypothetical protein n=1 Tax=Methanocalculus sp. TaxID=2004547 RepID=UPI00261470E6|nr:hypothetical protein [Methanocalculus sp.]MDG6251614.1 hypothetical protein [Methanocalculus sp.]
MSEYRKQLFAGFLGLLYLTTGLAAFIALISPEIELFALLGISGDPAMGFISIIIGLTLIFGYRELSKGIHEGVAYLHVGIALALVFGLIWLLSTGAGFATLAIFEGEEITFEMIREAIVPQLYLAVIALFGFIVWGREFSAGLLRD